MQGIDVVDDRPRRPAHLPRPRPARRLPDHARVRPSWPTCARWKQAIVAALRRRGRPAPRGRSGDGRDFIGVWTAERKIASIGVHRSRERDDARLRGQRRQRPAAVRVGRAVRPARRAHDLGHREARHTATTCAASASAWPSASPRPSAAASAWSRRRGWRRRSAPRRCPPGGTPPRRRSTVTHPASRRPLVALRSVGRRTAAQRRRRAAPSRSERRSRDVPGGRCRHLGDPEEPAATSRAPGGERPAAPSATTRRSGAPGRRATGRRHHATVLRSRRRGFRVPRRAWKRGRRSTSSSPRH